MYHECKPLLQPCSIPERTRPPALSHLHAGGSRKVRCVTDSADMPAPGMPAPDMPVPDMPAVDRPAPRRSPTPGAPTVGMVGAGQLARVSAQAAIGRGICCRVLADAPDDSAAQVWAATQLGDYRSAADLRAFAAGCD